MDEPTTPNVVLELTADEAVLVAAALRQFEPYWRCDLDDPTRADLLAGVRRSVDGLTGRLVPA